MKDGNSTEARVRAMYSQIRYPGLSAADNDAYVRHRKYLYQVQGLDLTGWLGGKLVLDAGCGTGEETLFLARQGAARVIGIDTSEGSIEHARQSAAGYGVDNVEFRVASVLDDSLFPDGHFDMVSSLGCIHHTPDTHRAFHNLGRMVRPGGYLNTFIYNSYGHFVYNLQCRLLDLAAGEDVDRRVRLGRRLFEWGSGEGYKREGISGSSEARLYDKYGVLYRDSLPLGSLLDWYREEGFSHVGSFPMYWSDLIDAYEARTNELRGMKGRVLRLARGAFGPRRRSTDWRWRRRLSVQALLLLLGMRDYGSSCRVLGQKQDPHSRAEGAGLHNAEGRPAE
ncbi:class I SAM-dependent methyltransferase [Candidatus Latescibacterota bacterium]